MTGPWEHEDWLDDSDWAAADALLAGRCPGGEAVRAAVAALEVMTHEPVVATGQLANSLLELWAAARVVGPEVSAPAEALLSVLPGRRLISSAEVASVCDETLRAIGPFLTAAQPDPVQPGWGHGSSG